MPEFKSPFRVDSRGCPDCRLELVPHPVTGLFVCPKCKFSRDHFQSEPARRGEVKVIEEATRTTENNHQEPEDLVTYNELAARWGLDYSGVLYRLKTHQIPRYKNADGKTSVRESDIAAQDWDRSVRRPKTQTSRNGTSSEVVKQEATPTRDVAIVSPIVGEIQVSDVDQATVRRLLLALRMIADLTEGAESADGFAVSAVARYALACEQQVTP